MPPDYREREREENGESEERQGERGDRERKKGGGQKKRDHLYVLYSNYIAAAIHVCVCHTVKVVCGWHTLRHDDHHPIICYMQHL